MSDGATGEEPRCRGCRAPIHLAAAFCPSCGRATPAHRDRVLRSTEGERSAARQAGRTAAVLFAGSLLVIAGAGFASDVFGLPEFGSRVLGNLLLAAIGVAGAAVVGLRSIRETMPFRPRATDLGWALAAAAGGAVAGALWIGLFRALGPDGPDPATPEDPLILRLVAIAVFPAVVEEWLCRGVLWRPLRPLLSPGITILVTAILFAFLHGLGDGYLLEIPHRFVGGLLFGFIRERSGSLSAPMLAHFEHNAFWVLIGRA